MGESVSHSGAIEKQKNKAKKQEEKEKEGRCCHGSKRESHGKEKSTSDHSLAQAEGIKKREKRQQVVLCNPVVILPPLFSST